MRAVLLALLWLGHPGVALAACAGAAAAVPAYEADGALPVATASITLVDTTRATPPNGTFAGTPERTLPTNVWYPGSTGGALTDTGPFPLVVASHGFAGSQTTLAYLAQHLASHGYVVAAPAFPLSKGTAPGGPTVADIAEQPRDVGFVIDEVLRTSSTPGSLLAGAVDPDALGGLTTLLAAYHRDLRDPRIGAAVAIAAPACFTTRRFYRTAKVPLLLVNGTTDLIVPFAANGGRARRLARPRATLVALDGGSHTGFSSFALSLSPDGPHFDTFTCPLLISALGESWNDPSDRPFRILATPGSGIASDPMDCPIPCTGLAPAHSMAGARQQAILLAATTAFLDARLRGDAAARCVVRRGIAEAYPDARVR